MRSAKNGKNYNWYKKNTSKSETAREGGLVREKVLEKLHDWESWEKCGNLHSGMQRVNAFLQRKASPAQAILA